MKGYIDGIDMHSLEPQRYWTPPSTWDEERKRKKFMMLFSLGTILAHERWMARFINL